MNAWIKDYAAKNGCVYLDYFSAMADPQNALKAELFDTTLLPQGPTPNDALFNFEFRV